MKKFLLATTLACSTILSTTAAYANFFNNQVGPWSIFGAEGTSEQNRACVMEYQWQDGSRFQLIKDLVDGELYIWFKNHSWNIGDAPGDYEGMTVVIKGSRGSVASWPATYSLVNKNTILIRNLNGADAFINAFAYLSEMTFVMPGNIQDALIPLTKTAAGLSNLASCVDASGNSETKKKLQGNTI